MSFSWPPITDRISGVVSSVSESSPTALAGPESDAARDGPCEVPGREVYGLPTGEVCRDPMKEPGLEPAPP